MSKFDLPLVGMAPPNALRRIFQQFDSVYLRRWQMHVKFREKTENFASIRAAPSVTKIGDPSKKLQFPDFEKVLNFHVDPRTRICPPILVFRPAVQRSISSIETSFSKKFRITEATNNRGKSRSQSILYYIRSTPLHRDLASDVDS